MRRNGSITKSFSSKKALVKWVALTHGRRWADELMANEERPFTSRRVPQLPSPPLSHPTPPPPPSVLSPPPHTSSPRPSSFRPHPSSVPPPTRPTPSSSKGVYIITRGIHCIYIVYTHYITYMCIYSKDLQKNGLLNILYL